MDSTVLSAAIDRAGRQIPPLFPLSATVAVNPFLGQTGLRLAETAAVLARAGGVAVTMPRAWFSGEIAAGRIGEADLEAALTASPYPAKPASIAALKSALAEARQDPHAAPTIAELAAEASGTDWPGLVANRIGAWAASHFDAGQALWVARPQGEQEHAGAWRAFRLAATHDLTPEIMGLTGFAAFVAEAPDDAGNAIARAVERLGIEEGSLEPYFHRLLMSLEGYAQLGAAGRA